MKINHHPPMHQTRYHIAYGRTMDAQCAAAIVLQYADKKSASICTYPLDDPSVPLDKTADLFTRVMARVYPANVTTRVVSRVYPANVTTTAQMELAEIEDPRFHCPADEIVYIIGAYVPILVRDELMETFTLNDTSTDAVGNRSLSEDLWHALYPKAAVPLAIQLVGRHALRADHNLLQWQEEILPFHYAMASVSTEPEHKNCTAMEEWAAHFFKLANPLTKKRINEGQVIMRALTAYGLGYFELPCDRVSDKLANPADVQLRSTDEV